jgi:excisionase family DNA binding protein
MDLNPELTALLADLPRTSGVTVGDAFEHVSDYALRRSVDFGHEIATLERFEVWARRHGMRDRDLGVDRIITTHQGDLWAVQNKGYAASAPVSLTTPPDFRGFFVSPGRNALPTQYCSRGSLECPRINTAQRVQLRYHRERRPAQAETGGADMTEPWLSADDIAVHLGVTKDTVYTWIAEKGMPAHKIGRLWKFQATEVDDWVRGGGAAGNVPDRAGG